MKNFSLSFTFLFVASLFISCSGTAQSSPDAGADATPKSGYQDLTVQEFQNLRSEQPEAVVLDVRTQQEVAQGMIEGAIHIDVNQPDFNNKIQQLDKDKTYLVYCRSGRRSVSACMQMEKAGFTDLYNLLGGILAYEKEAE